MTEFIDVIEHWVTVVGNWIFDRKIMFLIPLTSDKMYYCFTNGFKKKKVMSTKDY